MPWKTILLIIAATFAVLFIALNVDHKTEISLIFFTLDQVPVYLTVFVSMLIGALVMVPTVFRRRKRQHEDPSQDQDTGSRRKKQKADEIEESFSRAVENHGIFDAGDEKKSRSRRKAAKKAAKAGRAGLRASEQNDDIDLLK
jgi:uncharacterized integral membrane protein